MNNSEIVAEKAQILAELRPRFFEIKGAGRGDHDTIQYMADLRKAAEQATGTDYSEKRICGTNKLAVDFYVAEERTIIEIALSLRNPNSEFEKDVIKALMAKEEGFQVQRLFFISKPGGEKRLEQPGAQAIISWAREMHNLDIHVQDLRPPERLEEG